MNNLTPSYWQSRYEKGTTGWDRGSVHPALEQWVAGGELQPCQIVVPGCGRGYEVIYLSRLGFDVTAIDFATEPLSLLKQRLDEFELAANLVQADMFEFRPPQPFDVVYEQTCLCAIEPELRPRYEATVRQWLLPGGKLHVLFMSTSKPDGPPFDCPIDEMRKLFADDDWDWPEGEFEKHDHPGGPIFELGTILTRKA